MRLRLLRQTQAFALMLLVSCSGSTSSQRIEHRDSAARSKRPLELRLKHQAARLDAPASPNPVLDSPRQAFLKRLARVSRAMDGTLTPLDLGEIFSADVRTSSSPGWFELIPAKGVHIEVQGSSVQAGCRWIEFNSMRDLGVTLSDLESIYGSVYRSLPPAKDGTTVVFSPSAGALPPGAYIAAQLWSPRAEPASVVSNVQLRYPRQQ